MGNKSIEELLLESNCATKKAHDFLKIHDLFNVNDLREFVLLESMKNEYTILLLLKVIDKEREIKDD